MAKLLFATLALSTIASARASPRAEKTAGGPQTLFNCQTDRLFVLRPVTDGPSQRRYAVSARRATKGAITLSLDANSHTITLLLHYGRGPKREYVLTNLEQGSSPGSGTGGRADTTIRGTSAGEVFTLFAGYDNEGLDHHAALLAAGQATFLLACDGRRYSAPQVKGVGPHGSINIYVLGADGLAHEMKTLAVEPDFERH